MKLVHFTIIMPLILISCNSKQEKINIESAQDFIVQPTTIANKNQETDLTGRSINIKDIFVLLPENIFPEGSMKLAQRKELLKCIGEEKAFEISPTPIGACDVKNGYLNLTGMQYDWEVSYWNLKDERKLVIVNQGTESGSILNYFYYENGKLKEDINYDAIKKIVWKANDFIYLSRLNPNTQKVVEKKFAKADYTLYYKLPQKGTSIKVTLDTYALMDYSETNEISAEAAKEVKLKWVNEKWER